MLELGMYRELVKVVSLLYFLSNVGHIEGQTHFLKYANAGQQKPFNFEPQFDSGDTDAMLRNVGNKFVNADKICAQGIWALYNTTNWGVGAEDQTTVISVRATDLSQCSGSIPLLRNVRSLRYWGNANYGAIGMQIFSEPYFLGGHWTATAGALPMAIITGVALKSLAATGSSTSYYLLCSDTDNPCTKGVCINMRNFANLYLLRNADTDTSLRPVGSRWPKTVRLVTTVPIDVCSNYPGPVPPSNTTRRTKRHTVADMEGNVEIDIFP